MNNRNSIIGLISVSIVFILGFCTLYTNQSQKLEKASGNIKAGLSLTIDKDLDSRTLSKFLLKSDYLKDPKDASAIAQWITSCIARNGDPANLGSLNLPKFKMPVAFASAHGGEYLKTRVYNEQKVLGITDQVMKAYDGTVPSSLTTGNADATITINVTEPDSSLTGFSRLIAKIKGTATVPAEGVLVRLRQHYYDTIPPRDGADAGIIAADSIIGYAMTDAFGKARFNVPKGRFYSVVPIQPGYEFGRSKGTTQGALEGNKTYNFSRRSHRITPFDPSTYSRIKEDGALIVRTPEQYKDKLIAGAATFIIGWWGLFIFIFIMDLRHKRASDHLLMILLMTLTGIGLLTMYAISNPLSDKLIGPDMAQGLLGGLLMMALLSNINYLKFYNNQSAVQCGKVKFDFISQFIGWILSPLKSMVSKPAKALKNRGISYPDGIGYLILAVLMVLLLSIFGTGPEGSDAKVNLWFFQPSEVSKYLVVIFIAAFFTSNAGLIQAFSDRINKLTWKRQLGVVTGVVAALLFLLMLYLVVLSDMGPAMVIIITFIILYSVARKDLPHLLLGLCTFILLLVIARRINDTPVTMLMFSMIWLLAWTAGWWIKDHRIYESSIFLNLLILAFMLGGNIMSAIGMSEGQRLINRNSLAWSGVWNNEVPGGDQIAQGIWSVATGGFSGQGIGNGNPNLVPAYHTDMVFTSIGEILGWVALVLILLCFTILIHRSLLLARRAGHPFAFFLISGVAIVVGVQFLIIVSGSLGLIPLTGVSVPFLSFGKSSLMINLAFFGVVLSLTRQRATDNQRTAIKKYDGVIVAGSVFFFMTSLIIMGTLFYYQVIARDEYMIRPAMMTNLQGARIVEYNPRINLLINELDAGNIYDRNGLLLASSSREDIINDMKRLNGAGISKSELKTEVNKRKRRYYPLGDNTLFMLGDFNTRVVWNYSDSDPVGYVAENRHLSLLRGFDNIVRDEAGNPEYFHFITSEYRESQFLPPQEKELKYAKRDYSILLPMLKEGIDGQKVREWNDARMTRDITLTLDAALQTRMQSKIKSYIKSYPRLSRNRLLRASVVVLNAENGDMLCSANYPLPSQDTIKMLNDNNINGPAPYERDNKTWAYTQRDLGMTYQTQPGSTAKVMSAMAGFMQMGQGAADQRYFVDRLESIEGGSNEPLDWVTMENAIVLSSNCYFINLVHDKDLYPELHDLYQAVGARIDYMTFNSRYEKKEYHPSATPYFFELNEVDNGSIFDINMERARRQGIAKYNTYKNGDRPEKMNWHHTGIAWGQGVLSATPLNMARVAAIVANDGKLMPTRFILSHGNETYDPDEDRAISILQPDNAEVLKGYMQEESDKHRRNGKLLPLNRDGNKRIGGKTGTPHRSSGNNKDYNDGWYVFFINSEKEKAPLAIAVRMERLSRKGENFGSGAAVDFVADVVIPSLNLTGYKVE